MRASQLKEGEKERKREEKIDFQFNHTVIY